MRWIAGLVAVPLIVLVVVFLSMSQHEPVAAVPEATKPVVTAVPRLQLAEQAPPAQPLEDASETVFVEKGHNSGGADFAATLNLTDGQTDTSADPPADPRAEPPALGREVKPNPPPVAAPEAAVETPASDALQRYTVQEIHGREVREVTFVKIDGKWVRESVRRKSPPAAGSAD